MTTGDMPPHDDLGTLFFFRVSISSTKTIKIAVHSASSPESNPNVSQFAPTVVAFWADSNCDLLPPVCRALLDINKKTETGMPRVFSAFGEHHHGDGLPCILGVEDTRLRASRITSAHRILRPRAGRTGRSFAGRADSALFVGSSQRAGPTGIRAVGDA